MRLFSTKLVMSMFLLGALAGTAFPQQSDSGAKEDIKEAGRATKHAAKKTGSAVKKGTKKAVHATAKTARKGAEKVEDKTQSK